MASLQSQEFYDLIDTFERHVKKMNVRVTLRFDKEPKKLWVLGHIYQQGDLNQLFTVFHHGYESGKSIERMS